MESKKMEKRKNCSNNSNPKEKLHKLTEISDEIKIIDLHDDCLEKIFSYLSYVDLENVMLSNNHFSAGARYAFLNRNHMIAFKPNYSNRNNYDRFIHSLEAFGPAIRRLSITFYAENYRERYNKRNAILIKMIEEKCSGNLKELQITNLAKSMIFTKPLHNLEKILFFNSYFNEAMAQLISQSKKIKFMEFHSVENVFNRSFAEQHFPLLKHFGANKLIISDSGEEMLRNFRKFVSCNTGLASLGVSDAEIDMMYHNPGIRREFFEITHQGESFTDKPDQIAYLFPFESMYSGNLKRLKLSIGYSRDTMKSLFQILGLRILNLPLEELDLYVGRFGCEIIPFLLGRDIKTIRLYAREPLDLIPLVSIAWNLPKLEHYEIYVVFIEQPRYSIVPIAAREIINRCEHVKKFTIGFTVHEPIDRSLINYKENTYAAYSNYFNTFYEWNENGWKIAFDMQHIEDMRQYGRETLIFKISLEKAPKNV